MNKNKISEPPSYGIKKSSGKNKSPLEVERRWLLPIGELPASILSQVEGRLNTTVKGENTPYKQLEIQQAYLTEPHAPVMVRVRRSQEKNKKAKFYQTVKSPAPFGCEGVSECEFLVAKENAIELFQASLARINKTRLVVPLIEREIKEDKRKAQLFWEFDFFKDALSGLIIVELEVPSLSYPVNIPPYFGPEITGDKSFSNVSLAFEPKAALGRAQALLSDFSFQAKGEHKVKNSP